MVDRLGPLTRAIAVLRKSLDKPGTAAANRSNAAAQTQRQPKPASQSTPSHVGTLASRLAVLRRDDPQRNRKALRLFIEAVLLDEFGEELILGADFERLVDRAVAALESDDSLRQTLIQASEELFPQG